MSNHEMASIVNVSIPCLHIHRTIDRSIECWQRYINTWNKRFFYDFKQGQQRKMTNT